MLAVFSEQAASASHVEAARSLDALARMPDCEGFNIDAIGASHQILSGADCPTTLCTVPEHRRPPEGATYKKPNEYLWSEPLRPPESKTTRTTTSKRSCSVRTLCPSPTGRRRCAPPEEASCVSVRGSLQVGRGQEQLRTHEKELRAKMDLDEAVPLNGDVYLKWKQERIAPPLDLR